MRAGLLCGLAAPVLWGAVIVLAGAQQAGFDHVGQYISELGERGSATQALMRYAGFGATGVLHIGFAIAFHAVLRPAAEGSRLPLFAALLVALNGIGRIGAGAFACTPGCADADDFEQRLHHLFASVAFFALIGAALLGAAFFRRQRGLRGLAAYSLASGLAGLLFLGLMSAGGATHAVSGLHERLASAALSLWVFVSAAHLWRWRRAPT